jgi:UDP-2,3-diacylglucosamine pyrophosphatase LpxH
MGDTATFPLPSPDRARKTPTVQAGMIDTQQPAEAIAFRSIWISDVHLGTKHAHVADLLDFLRITDCRYLYVVGDLIDGWELRFRWYWRDDHNVLIQKLLRKSRKQTRVIYLTGNHDEFMEEFTGMRFGSVTLAQQVIHIGADGREYLVTHGHQADGLTHFNHLLEKVGSHLYNWILDFNLHFNRLRRALGFGYWSLAAYLKFKAKSAMKFVTQYEETLAQMARKQGVHGIICGHIHRPEIKTIGDVQYLNCGDWVESCTALVEHFDGRIELIHFHENDAIRARRGAGSHDPGHGGQRNGRGGGPPDRGRDARRGDAPRGASLLRIGDEDARRPPADAGVRL